MCKRTCILCVSGCVHWCVSLYLCACMLIFLLIQDTGWSCRPVGKSLAKPTQFFHIRHSNCSPWPGCLRLGTRAHACTNTHMRVRRHTHKHKRGRLCTRTHTHTHTHTHVPHADTRQSRKHKRTHTTIKHSEMLLRHTNQNRYNSHQVQGVMVWPLL